MSRIAKRLLARFGIWRSDNVSTVPPELAACEYGCVHTECAEDRFETCERRLRTAAVLQAEAATQDQAVGSERPEPCVVPVIVANDGAPASEPDRTAAR